MQLELKNVLKKRLEKNHQLEDLTKAKDSDQKEIKLSVTLKDGSEKQRSILSKPRFKKDNQPAKKTLANDRIRLVDFMGGHDEYDNFKKLALKIQLDKMWSNPNSHAKIELMGIFVNYVANKSEYKSHKLQVTDGENVGIDEIMRKFIEKTFASFKEIRTNSDNLILGDINYLKMYEKIVTKFIQHYKNQKSSTNTTNSTAGMLTTLLQSSAVSEQLNTAIVNKSETQPNQVNLANFSPTFDRK